MNMQILSTNILGSFLEWLGDLVKHYKMSLTWNPCFLKAPQPHV